MGFYRINQSVAVNINFVTLEGQPVTGLTDGNISLTLIKNGITQSIAGHYTISPQQRGIYRVVFDSSIMTTSDVDYVLIAQDTTDQGLDDKVEFTLYDETIDTVYSKLKTEIDTNENKIDSIVSYTDEVEALLKNTTYGVAALKTKLNDLESQHSTNTNTIVNEVISQANENEIKIDNLTSNVSQIIPEINSNENKLDVLTSYIDEVEALLKNAAYGLNAAKGLQDTYYTNLANSLTVVQNEVISQANENEAKLDILANDIALIVPEINSNENKLDVITSYIDEVEALLKHTTYGLSSLKTKLTDLESQHSSNTNTIVNEVISQANQNETKIDTILSNQSSDTSGILVQVGVANNKLDVVTAYTDEIETLLKNTTYGLSAAKNLQDSNYANLANDLTEVQGEVILQSTNVQTKIDDAVSGNFDAILTEINTNETKLDVILSYTDEVEALLKNATYGLSKLKDKLDLVQSAQITNTSFIINEVISQANENENKIDAVLTQFPTVISEINNNENKLDSIISYVDEVEPLLKNATYGLSKLKDTLAILDSQGQVNTTNILNEVIYKSNQNEVKIDGLINNLILTESNIVSEINITENKVDSIVSYVNEVEPLLKNTTYGLSSINTKLEELQAQDTVNTVLLQSEVISQANQNEAKIDAVINSLGNAESNLSAQILLIPTTPLLSDDSRVSKLNLLDTSSSQIATLAAQEVWSYSQRYLSGTSGVNQIDVAGLSTGFLINQNASVNTTLIHKYTGDLITGRTYPTNIGIELWKGGVLVDSSANITCVETASSVYRVTINAALINTPAIDYILVVSDLLNEATSQIVEFTAFEITGVAGPRAVTIHVRDSATLLPLPDVQVYVRDTSNIMTINKGLTNDSGNYNTGLKEGTYQVILRKTHVDFTVPEILTVSGDTNVTYNGVAFSPSLPIAPDTCVLYGYVMDISGNYLKNAKITATETDSNTYSGEFKVLKLVKSTTSDVNGYWELELIYSSALTPIGIPYKIDITYPGFNYSANVLIPNSASVEFSTLI